jgi:predicted Zn finger-like uncharacterized protein
MPEEKYTRCPGCRTIFRVTDQQLALRDGQVRCGHCKHVFDGNAERISLAPRPAFDQPFHDEDLYGPPTVTLRSSRALEAVPSTPAPAVPSAPESATSEPVAPEPVPSATAASMSGAASEPGTRAVDDGPAWVDPPDGPGNVEAPSPEREAGPQIDYAERFSHPRRTRLKGVFDKLAVLALPLLLLALMAQAAFHFRDALAAHVPAAKPTLVKACAFLGCTVGPLQEASGLSIDASDLQADPAHRGLLMLTATLRNRTGVLLAYPYLELTLTDAQDQVVVRRVLLPADYVGGGADLNAGIPANTEVPVKLFIDASATTQAGYRLYAFYP